MVASSPRLPGQPGTGSVDEAAIGSDDRLARGGSARPAGVPLSTVVSTAADVLGGPVGRGAVLSGDCEQGVGGGRGVISCSAIDLAPSILLAQAGRDFDALGGRTAAGPERGDGRVETTGEDRASTPVRPLGTSDKNVSNTMNSTPNWAFGPIGVVTLVP